MEAQTQPHLLMVAVAVAVLARLVKQELQPLEAMVELALHLLCLALP